MGISTAQMGFPAALRTTVTTAAAATVFPLAESRGEIYVMEYVVVVVHATGIANAIEIGFRLKE